MIVFRCDADEFIGYGHFFRSLSLAATMKNAGESVIIATSQASPMMARYADIYGIDVWQGDVSAKQLRAWNTQWVVIDDYHISNEYTRRLVAEFQVVVIDDLARAPIAADILLNTNYGSEKLPYVLGRTTTTLFGPRYALLRPEFSEKFPSATEPRVFVCLGGGDNSEILQQVVDAIPSNWAAIVVPGSSTITTNRDNIVVINAPNNMAVQMSQCTHAVVGAGSTVWECLAMGLNVAAIKLVDNQDIIARELSTEQIIIWLNSAGTLDQNLLKNFLDDAVVLVPAPMAWRDGLGAQRVGERMRALSIPLRIRLATFEDARAVWEINNDPVARQNAVNQAAIPYPDHLNWFENSIRNSDRILWVLPSNDTVQGVVRADLNSHDARMSIAVALNNRGIGVGKTMLGQAIDRLEKIPDIDTMSAIIRPENHASVRLFEKTGFTFVRNEYLGDERFLYFERHKHKARNQ